MTDNAAETPHPDASQDPMELFRTDGEVSKPDSGWTYQAGSDEEMVYIPFEGVYPNKGGRMQSPWFTIPESDRGAYYRLTFKAKTAEHCYWWLDYRDKDGQRRPDCNSQVVPTDEEREYDEVVYIPSAVRGVQIAFVSKGKVEASDVRFTTATPEEAVQWCDELYKTMPPLDFTPPSDAMAALPKTVAAMKEGAPWRVVMLGHSITNDSFNSLYQALIQRDFPRSRLNVVASVRGSTNCSYYREPEHFATYVTEKKPDLLMILGSAGSCEDLASVVEQTRAQVGCEMLVLSMPLARDWRKDEGITDWRDLMDNPEAGRHLSYIPTRDCCRKLEVPFWDLTAPCNDYIAAAPDLDYNRDHVHNNNIGKQIIGRVLHQYFLTAR